MRLLPFLRWFGVAALIAALNRDLRATQS